MLAADRTPLPDSDARVLLIDDDDLIVRSLQHTLLAQGCHVDTARDARRADELMSSVTYAVIAVDPYLTGEASHALSLLATIRRRQPHSQIIVLTAYPSDELTAEARVQQAIGVFEKPKPLPFLTQLLVAVRRVATAKSHLQEFP